MERASAKQIFKNLQKTNNRNWERILRENATASFREERGLLYFLFQLYPTLKNKTGKQITLLTTNNTNLSTQKGKEFLKSHPHFKDYIQGLVKRSVHKMLEKTKGTIGDVVFLSNGETVTVPFLKRVAHTYNFKLPKIKNKNLQVFNIPLNYENHIRLETIPNKARVFRVQRGSHYNYYHVNNILRLNKNPITREPLVGTRGFARSRPTPLQIRDAPSFF